MIKPNELRIGNWVNENGKNKRVTALMTGYIATEIIDGEPLFTGIGVYDSIPLTTEILEKCGFIKNNLEYWEKETKSNENDLDLEEVNGKFIPVINNEYSVGIEIKYLHQLQNKYFDWYGEELKIPNK
jgi:hypothetical protein